MKNNITKTKDFPYYHTRNETAPARRGQPDVRACVQYKYINRRLGEYYYCKQKSPGLPMLPPMDNIIILVDAERAQSAIIIINNNSNNNKLRRCHYYAASAGSAFTGARRVF